MNINNKKEALLFGFGSIFNLFGAVPRCVKNSGSRAFANDTQTISKDFNEVLKNAGTGK
ncbi:MAG: hypothetical protein Q4P84_00160 [Elusimicrobiales bacterium]|nr:hypothetical protein [Elusimicrobiales bacterium]